MILEGLFGNATAPKALIYLQLRDSGYPLAIAQTFSVPVNQVQRQLERFAVEGILSSRMVGKTRIYSFNPRCFYLDDLRGLLKKAAAQLPKEELAKITLTRERPRRVGKRLPK